MPRFLSFPGPRTLVLICASLTALGVVRAAGQGQGAPPAQAPAGAAQPDRQFPRLTFKVEVNYVEVDAVVTDAQGRFVDTLRQGDFQVLEDGKPQSISSFGVVNVPVEYADAPLFVKQPIEPDVQTNVKAFDGRVYLIVLDQLHTSPINTARVRQAAKRFVQTQMGANDVAAVVTTGAGGSAAQEFTGNRRLLTSAIDHFIGRSLRSATLNKIDDYNRIRNLQMSGLSGPRDPEEQERAYNARATLDAVRGLSDFLAGVRGRRKALLLFSEGIDYNIVDPFNNPSASDIRDETRRLIAAATRANVNIYPIDPRGLTEVGGDASESTTIPSNVDPSLGLTLSALQDELRFQQDSLRVLADQTGGFAAINSNDFSTAFNRIRDENSHYYVLGYYPTNDRRDGRFRKIQVRVTKPGLQVRARQGYVAPSGKPETRPASAAKEGTSPVLRETLDSPLPISGLRLRVFAAPFKGTAPNASIAVLLHAEGGDLKFTEKNGKFEDAIEMSLMAIEASTGKVKNGVRQKVNMPLKPESRDVVARTGIRTLARIDLPPGKYQLRVAALDTGSGALGSVFYDLEVPNFLEGPLTMSGVVLTSSLAAQGPAAGFAPDDPLRTSLPAPPTVARDFLPGEELALLAEVYDNEPSTAHKVSIATTLRSDDGREVFRIEDERSSSELQGKRGGYGYTAHVPLKGLSPGLYVVKVEARSTLGKGAAISRELQIRVLGS